MEELPKYLLKSEAKKLKVVVGRSGNSRDIAIFELLLTYGPRASEIGLLKLSDINVDEKTIVIPRLKHGKINVWPMLSNFEFAVTEWLKERNSVTEWVFPGSKLKGLSRKRIWELMRKYGGVAGLPKEKQHPHACRHYAAVNALDAGLEIVDVQDLLGHSAITSTMIYAQITSKRRNQAAQKLEKFND